MPLGCLPRAGETSYPISFCSNARRRYLTQVLQEVEKYRRLNADIKNQPMAKVKQIAKEQLEELLEQGRKEGKEDFFTKNYKYFRYPRSQCRLKYEAL